MKVCEVCGTAFEATNNRQKFCTPACRQKAFRKRRSEDRAVPLEATDRIWELEAELRAMRSSRDYYRRTLEAERDSQDVFGDVDRLKAKIRKLQRYIRREESRGWRSALSGVYHVNRTMTSEAGEIAADSWSRSIVNQMSVLIAALGVARGRRLWQYLGYPDEEFWWKALLDLADPGPTGDNLFDPLGITDKPVPRWFDSGSSESDADQTKRDFEQFAAGLASARVIPPRPTMPPPPAAPSAG